MAPTTRQMVLNGVAGLFHGYLPGRAPPVRVVPQVAFVPRDTTTLFNKRLGTRYGKILGLLVLACITAVLVGMFEYGAGPPSLEEVQHVCKSRPPLLLRDRAGSSQCCPITVREVE